MDELHLELAGADGAARLHGDDLGGVQQLVLLELELDKAGGEAGAVDGHVHLLEHIGDGADVILVAMGDEEAAEATAVFDEVADIGNDAVDAVHVVAGEGHAAVHHDDLAAVLIDGHVLADLVEAAQRDDFQFFCHKSFDSPFCDPWSQGRCARKNARQNKDDPPALGPASPCAAADDRLNVTVFEIFSGDKPRLSHRSIHMAAKRYE